MESSRRVSACAEGAKLKRMVQEIPRPTIPEAALLQIMRSDSSEVAPALNIPGSPNCIAIPMGGARILVRTTHYMVLAIHVAAFHR